MSEMIERVAQAMYWDRVDPNCNGVTLSVAVRDWGDLPDEHKPGIQIWHCKTFWRKAARAAIEAMYRPTDAMVDAGDEACGIFKHAKNTWRLMIDEALK